MKNYWFKAKRYGWGWTPSSREGWLVMLAWLLAVLYMSSRTESVVRAGANVFTQVALPAGLLTLLLLIICYKTGEPLAWHWGDKEDKK